MKQNHQTQPRKPDPAKKIVSFLPYVLAVLLLLGIPLTRMHYRHLRERCTNEIVGTVTNLTHKPKKTQADIVVKTDGIFPSQTIRTTRAYHANMEEVQILYDPDDPETYYFAGQEQEEVPTCITFAVLAVLEIGFGILIRRVYRKSLAPKA